MVHLIGLEPTQPKLPDPKSGASTNSATSALADAKLVKNDETGKILCDFYDPHRPVRMLVTVGADVRNDRRGCHISAFYYSLHSVLLTVSCPRTLILASSNIELIADCQ